MNIDQYEVSSIAMQVQEKLLKEQRNILVKERSLKNFYVKIYVKILEAAYISKKMIDSF